MTAHADWFPEALAAGDGWTLEIAYELVAGHPSDIRAHVPLLRALAAGCGTVVELGVRHGVSTVALLAGWPRRLVSVDCRTPRTLGTLRGLAAEETRWHFVRADSRRFVRPAAYDGLFIDTQHTAACLRAELAGRLPARWIAVHDTHTFGRRGCDGGPGLNVALAEFLAAHSAWERSDYPGDNGLTVLRRKKASQ